ncbi:YbbR-like domain-containing protein [Echinicola jeungdonensis]|uniref:YbbR-like domain-containing protein n=1 Tax=Echinicola jeungdonensis TaxID=709343 RepID=A0ABV5J590_9BACT|nr:YbbR-like domain-containing protein [Echinicola jeungdonensis]MDN3668666.1 YbbR-like domain-containing protein [Echinicola jeungdonensis]
MLSTIRNYIKSLSKQKTSDIKVVALCVLAATTFWVLNALNKDNYVSVVNYPIEFQYNKEEFMAIEKLPTEVRVEINGDGWDILRKYFKFNVTPFTIELGNPASQNYLLASTIKRSLAEVLAPTKLQAILTDTLKFNFDRIVSKEIQITLDTSSTQLAPNFKLASPIHINPSQIEILGPSSMLEELGDRIYIQLDKESISQNFDENIPIIFPENLRDYLTTNHASVRVTFDVVEFLKGNKRLKINQINFPPNVSLLREVNSVIMNYRVDERRVSDLQEIQMEGILDYDNRNKMDSTISIELKNIPEFIEGIEIEPNTFKLKYD